MSILPFSFLGRSVSKKGKPLSFSSSMLNWIEGRKVFRWLMW